MRAVFVVVALVAVAALVSACDTEDQGCLEKPFRFKLEVLEKIEFDRCAECPLMKFKVKYCSNEKGWLVADLLERGSDKWSGGYESNVGRGCHVKEISFAPRLPPEADCKNYYLNIFLVGHEDHETMGDECWKKAKMIKEYPVEFKCIKELPEPERKCRAPKLVPKREVSECKEGHVALTFDDTITPELLDVLKQREVPATFFPVGSRCAPEHLKRACDEGHMIASHTYSHGHPDLQSDEEFRKDIDENEAYLQKHIGFKPQYFRFPYFEESDVKRKTMIDRGYCVVGQNFNPQDYNRPGKVFEYMTQLYGKLPDKRGLIPIQHAASSKPEEVGQFIDFMHGKGYKFVRLDDCFDEDVEKAIEMPPFQNPEMLP